MKKYLLLLSTVTFFAYGSTPIIETVTCKTAACKNILLQLEKRKNISDKQLYLNNLSHAIRVELPYIDEKSNPEKIKELQELKDCVEFLNNYEALRYIENIREAQPLLAMATDITTFPFIVHSTKELENLTSSRKAMASVSDEHISLILNSSLCKTIYSQCLDSKGMLDKEKLNIVKFTISQVDEWDVTNTKVHEKRPINIPEDIYKKALAIKTCCKVILYVALRDEAKKNLDDLLNDTTA